jgi:hypothetical protein
MRSLIAAALLFFPSVAIAQTDRSEPIIQQRTVLDFEGDLVEAGLDNPDLTFIEAIKRHRHTSLIRIRESFDDRLVQSAKQL